MRDHPTIAANAKQLNRLAALLLALAGLAERAAGSSGAVCLLVLWLIRPSEAIARDLVENLAPGAVYLPEPAAALRPPPRPCASRTVFVSLPPSSPRWRNIALPRFRPQSRTAGPPDSWRPRPCARLAAAVEPLDGFPRAARLAS
jgi:hypothetical protein